MKKICFVIGLFSMMIFCSCAKVKKCSCYAVVGMNHDYLVSGDDVLKTYGECSEFEPNYEVYKQVHCVEN